MTTSAPLWRGEDVILGGLPHRAQAPAAQLGAAYLAGQVYLKPQPKELMLRNHV